MYQLLFVLLSLRRRMWLPPLSVREACGGIFALLVDLRHIPLLLLPPQRLLPRWLQWNMMTRPMCGMGKRAKSMTQSAFLRLLRGSLGEMRPSSPHLLLLPILFLQIVKNLRFLEYRRPQESCGRGVARWGVGVSDSLFGTRLCEVRSVFHLVWDRFLALFFGFWYNFAAIIFKSSFAILLLFEWLRVLNFRLWQKHLYVQSRT